MTRYYSVGKNTYSTRMEALVSSKLLGEPVQWHFGEDAFKKAFNSKENLTLDEVYRRRAQQLRRKYDYLILAFSGGSDSVSMLRAFLNNSIPVEEIYISWPKQALDNMNFVTSHSLDSSNVWSEWDLAIYPYIEKLKVKFPNIKITINDWSSAIEDDSNDETLLLTSAGTALDLGNVSSRKSCRLLTHVDALVQLGKKVTIVYGIEKPCIAKRGNQIEAYFLDSFFYRKDGFNINAEYFFWADECPELVVTQTRKLANFFIGNPEFMYLIDWPMINGIYTSVITYEQKQVLNTIVRSVVYPDWDSRTFQANKITNDFDVEFYRAFVKRTSSSRLTKFYGALDEVCRYIPAARVGINDQEYVENLSKIIPQTKGSISPFVSPFYTVCQLDNR